MNRLDEIEEKLDIFLLPGDTEALKSVYELRGEHIRYLLDEVKRLKMINEMEVPTYALPGVGRMIREEVKKLQEEK